MGALYEAGPDCVWAITEDPVKGQSDRRAYYPWDAPLLTLEHTSADWLSSALDHLAQIGQGGGE